MGQMKRKTALQKVHAALLASFTGIMTTVNCLHAQISRPSFDLDSGNQRLLRLL